MGTEDVSAAIHGILAEAVGALVQQHLPPHAMPGDWDLEGLAKTVAEDFNVHVDPKTWLEQEPELEEAALRERLVRVVDEAYQAKGTLLDAPLMRHIEKDVMLRTLDSHWREHLAAMDYLRQGIHLVGYAQQDYRTEYKRKAFEMFTSMLDEVKFETVSTLMRIEVRTQEEVDREEEERRARLMRALQAQHAEAQLFAGGADAAEQPAAGGMAGMAGTADLPLEPQSPFVRAERKVGRNEPCPCGSGKKYKHCHGTLSNVG